MHLLSVALLFLLCKVDIILFAIDHPLLAVVELLCAADIFFQLNILPSHQSIWNGGTVHNS